MNGWGVVVSVFLHVGVFLVITRTPPPVPVMKKTAIRVVQQKPEQKKPEPPPPEPVKANTPEARAPEPPPPPPKNEPVKPKPKAKAGPEADGADAQTEAKAPPLDLANMTYSNDSGNGPAVSPDSVGRDLGSQQPQTPKAKPRAVEKVVGDKPKAADASECVEELVKPKAINKVPIDYPSAAREQGIEGQLVLRAHVGADGKVGEIEIVKSAGALIDEPAIAALKGWTFEPATKCGKPVESTFTISRRFELGT